MYLFKNLGYEGMVKALVVLGIEKSLLDGSIGSSEF